MADGTFEEFEEFDDEYEYNSEEEDTETKKTSSESKTNSNEDTDTDTSTLIARGDIKTKLPPDVIRSIIKLYQREYIPKVDTDYAGINIILDPKNPDVLQIMMSNFDRKSTLAKDMEKYKIDFLDCRLIFTEEYPFKRPIFFIKSPICSTIGHDFGIFNGVICVQILTEAGYNPTLTYLAILLSLKSYLHQNLKITDPTRETNIHEALEGLKRIENAHKKPW